MSAYDSFDRAVDFYRLNASLAGLQVRLLRTVDLNERYAADRAIGIQTDFAPSDGTFDAAYTAYLWCCAVRRSITEQSTPRGFGAYL